jgi:hypothetical protein
MENSNIEDTIKCLHLKNQLKQIDTFNNIICNSDINLIQNVEFLTEIINPIGLFYDERMHPENNTISMYGDDVKYMYPIEVATS